MASIEGSGGGGGSLSLMDDEKKLYKCLFCDHLLDDPVLLGCLHSCCRQCLQRPDAQAPNSSDGSVYCKMCDITTKPEEVMENYFLAGQVQSLRFLRGGGRVSCDTCDDDENGDGDAPQPPEGQEQEKRQHNMADQWCRDCRKAICGDCLAWHDRFNSKHQVQSLEEVHASGTFAPPMVCSAHRKPLDLMCFQCDVPKCRDCLTECTEQQHDVQPLQSEKVNEYAIKVRKDLGELHEKLVAKTNELRAAHDSLCEEAEKNRKVCLDDLQNNKRKAIDAVEQAYTQAEEEWHQKCDEMMESAMRLQEEAERLAAHGRYVMQYTNALLQSDDSISLLQQERRVLECLEKITKRAEELDKEVDEVDKYVIVGELPTNLEDIMRDWVGVPKLKRELAAAAAAAAAAGPAGAAAAAATAAGADGATAAPATAAPGPATEGGASGGGATSTMGAAEDAIMDRAMGGLIADMQRNIIGD